MTNKSTSKGTLLTEILSLSKKFITIHSTEDNKEGLEEILSFASNQLTNFTKKEFLSNGKPSLLIHNSSPETKHFKIILNAHLDVVPGKKDQFKPVIKDGKLYGRGAYDMKAAAAVMILIFKELAKEINYPLALQLVTDEEIGGHDCTQYQIGKGITADFVIAGENTSYEIRHKSKSLLWMKLKTTGKASHAAYPWVGENAIQKMHKALEKLEKIYPTPKQAIWKTTVNVAKIETPNETFNRVPDECIVWLDIRFTPEEEDDILPNIKRIITSDTQIEIVVKENPAYTDPANPYIQSLRKIIKTYSKDDGEIKGANGSSDIRFFNAMVNVPGIEFGPKGICAHGDDECVDIDSLEMYYHILKDFLLSVK
ncbi:MAG TPA: M20/M25/M40 family metallo-hydrolase [Candidatus Saccharimonadales bacterium]|nr:M20/M25/M40 family metallo-hydrolase [Candidatus Saccharimonadales bacterium]